MLISKARAEKPGCGPLTSRPQVRVRSPVGRFRPERHSAGCPLATPPPASSSPPERHETRARFPEFPENEPTTEQSAGGSGYERVLGPAECVQRSLRCVRTRLGWSSRCADSVQQPLAKLSRKFAMGDLSAEVVGPIERFKDGAAAFTEDCFADGEGHTAVQRVLLGL
jgi:hypothetical protein